MNSTRVDLFRIVKRRLEEEYNKRSKAGENKILAENFFEICRICLGKDTLHSIFALSFKGKDLKDLIEFATCTEIKENDNLPSNICLKCYTDIIKAFFIKETSQKSHTALKAVLKGEAQLLLKEEEEETTTAEDENFELETSEVVEEMEEVEESMEQQEENTEETTDDGYFLVFDDIDEIFHSSVDSQGNEISVESSDISFSNEKDETTKSAYLKEGMLVKDGAQNNLTTSDSSSKPVNGTWTNDNKYLDSGDHTYSRVIKLPNKVSSSKNKTTGISDISAKGVQTFESAYIEQIKKTMGELSYENNQLDKIGNEEEVNTEEDYEGDNSHEYVYIENVEEGEEIVDGDDSKEIFYITNLEDSEIIEESIENEENDITTGFGHTNVWFGCKICGERFTQNSSLKKHIRSHIDDKEYVCELCDKTFSQKSALLEHSIVHGVKIEVKDEEPREAKEVKVNPGESICKICNVTFATRYEYRSHRAQKHKEKNFLCPTCGKMFASSTSLHTHIKALHRGEKSTCEICNKTFSSYGNLKLHHSRHHTEEGRPYKCNLCLKAFVTTTDLKFHMQVHSGEKNFICQVCGKGFRLKTSYNSHTLIHTGERPHQCKICLRRFVQPTHLNYHSLTHTGERPHACHYCGKTFALKGNLTVHIRTHTGERPYVCDVCGKGFYDSSSMKKHRRGHHGEDPVIPAVLSIVNEENHES